MGALVSKDPRDNYWVGFLTGALLVSWAWAVVWFLNLMMRGVR